MLLDRLVQPPEIFKKIYPEAVWKIDNSKKQVFLTFDDGPIPEVTPWVVGLLRKYSIKSTFFCVGENVEKYPAVYRLLVDEGHAVGNHTYNHLQGLKTGNRQYFQNIEKAAVLIDSDLFRPPHGLLSRGQYRFLKDQFNLVMWDILSCDTRAGISKEKVLRNVFSFVRPGSIITFHDSVKSFDILKETLPIVIEKLKDDGYSFLRLESKKINALSSHS